MKGRQKTERTEKWCPHCEEMLPAENYYTRQYKPGKFQLSPFCKKCSSEVAIEYHIKRTGNEFYGIRPNPGDWHDEEQRQATHEMLTKVFGWSLNEENGIYYKSGIKEKDGTWPNIPERERIVSNSDGINIKMNKEVIEEIRKLHKMGMDAREIAKQLHTSKTSVYKYRKG